MKYLNDLSVKPHITTELAGHGVAFNGYDRPRYIYPAISEAGYLGIDDWSGYWNKAAYASEGTGTLDAAKFYSIIVVPVKTNISVGGFPIYGEATAPSIPQKPSDAKSFNYTIPVHSQKAVKFVGTATANGTGECTDSAAAFTVDALIGLTLLNVDTGLTAEITDNTATVITAAGVDFTAADRYQVLESAIQSRLIYVAQMAAATDVLTANYYLSATILNNTATTHEVTSFAESATIWDFSAGYLQPPNANCCAMVSNILFCGGGIKSEATGTVAYLDTEETAQATATANEYIATSIVDDDYTAAGTARIMRLTLGSELTPFANAYVGSYVTITSAEDTGNNIANARVLQVAADGTWIEILNNTGVANADDEAVLITLTPNVIVGTSTIFSEGMKDAGFSITADADAAYTIAWVDPVAQILGLAQKYDGSAVAASTLAYTIRSDYSIYYSDSVNPHRFRGGNIISIGDSITGLSSIGDNLIAFCSNSVWRIPIESLGSTPVLLSNNVRCPAQFSIVKGERLLLFYDGTGFSVTDGVTVQSVTAYKAASYLANINKTYESQIFGAYDREKKRFEFVMPMGAESKNNYGIHITEGSWSCFPFSRPDCAALWDSIYDGDSVIYHGTGGTAVASGNGTIWRHEGATDGTASTNAYLFAVASVSGQTLNITSADGDTDLAIGDIVTIWPSTSGGEYRQAIVKTVTKTSTDPAPVTYALVFDAQYSISDLVEGDVVAYGLIPFDYGIKWDDFSSPQYLHQVRTVQVEIEGMYGIIEIDHFYDMNTDPVGTTSVSVLPGAAKLNFPCRGGKGYKYGFRLRGMSLTQFKITSFEILFNTSS